MAGRERLRVCIDEGELRVGDTLVESISEALDWVDFVLALVSLSRLLGPVSADPQRWLYQPRTSLG